MNQKRYLGDSVYSDIENGMVKLFTDNGCGETNVIYLEPEVCGALKLYIDEVFLIETKEIVKDFT